MTTPQTAISALIFDMDGVIIDSNPAHREAWTSFNRRYGIDTTSEMIERMYGKRNDEIVRDFFGGGLTEAEIADRGREKERLYREMIATRIENMLVPGLREFLNQYRNLPMAVASNAEPENVDFLLDEAGLRPLFRALVNGHQVSRPKPFPDLYLLAAKLLAVEPSECVVFEDSPAGTAAGAAAGMRVVGIRTTYVNLPDTVLTVDNFCSRELDSWLRAQLRPVS